MQDERLEKLLKAALGPYSISLEGHPPNQIYLNTRLMWEVLELACSSPTAPTAGKGLLDWTLTSIEPPKKLDEIVFQVGCASSPDVNVDTSDGGQSAPMLVSMTSGSSMSYPDMATPDCVQAFPTNASAPDDPSDPWLWDIKDASTSIQFYDLQTGTLGDVGNSSWWEFGDL